MPIFNKLVRDNIPALIAADGRNPITRVLDDEEYLTELQRKLSEETAEFLADPCIEELADVLEVVYALAGAIGASRDALEIARREKAEARGGFQARVFLLETD